jgi:uncharacterized protein with ParB-like and HNH nuclease domain
METDYIGATEEAITKLYGEDYLYEIPRFQRPFTWDKDNFQDLIDDIVSAYEIQKENYGSPIDGNAPDTEVLAEYEPYFLGSIILNREKNTSERYQIIDGQQRLTSLSILIAVMRDLMNESWGIDEWPSNLQEFIYEPGNVARNKSETVRIKVRKQERDFFKENVLTEGATLDPQRDGLSDPEEAMVTAIEEFSSYLGDWEGNPIGLASFLTQRVLMVRISTRSLKSAYRLFNVTNARGTPLNSADLLKSINLHEINKQDRDEYADIWEKIEEKEGNDGLEDIIGYMRHIIQKDKNRSTIHEEFKERIFNENPDFRGKQFIESLQSVYDTYQIRINDAVIESGNESTDIRYHNLVSLMRNVYPSDEWIIAMISYDQQFDTGHCEFITKLERRLGVAWYTRTSNNNRYQIVYDLLDVINEADRPEAVLESETLTELPSDADETLETYLDATNFYRRGNFQWPKYLLLRLELSRHRNSTTRREYGNTVTIEHILPQTPDADYWKERFDEEFADQWANKLGNLVPLEGSKNYSVGNKPFDEKYEGYFAEKVSDMRITNELEKHDEWTPEKLRVRHNRLIEETKSVWLKRN